MELTHEITIKWWGDELENLTQDHKDQLKYVAVERAKEMIEQDYKEGELNTTIIIGDMEVGVRGWWSICQPVEQCYLTQLEEMTEKALNELRQLISEADSDILDNENGVDGLTIKDDNVKFNMDNGRYIVFASPEKLIDNHGHEYDLEVLPHNELFQVIDHLIETCKK